MLSEKVKKHLRKRVADEVYLLRTDFTYGELNQITGTSKWLRTLNGKPVKRKPAAKP